MKSTVTIGALLITLQGCASVHEAQLDPGQTAAKATSHACKGPDAVACAEAQRTNGHAPIVLRANPVLGLSNETLARGDEIGSNAEAPVLEGRPLTSVVVTQCNLVVAVYMTMEDGRLLRFDKRAEVPAQELVTIAYTAGSSERVEVACDGLGAAAFEKHGAI
jgi:hypothetical protein